MSTWTIEARDPLVFRDGRPNHGRSESVCLPFPVPGTLAGIARTRLGSKPGRGFVLSPDEAKELFRVALRGPLLARGRELFVPRPADSLFAATETGRLTLTALRPVTAEAGVGFDEALGSGLLPVGLSEEDVASPELAGKPPRGLVRFWAWSAVEAWLCRRALEGSDVEGTGLEGPGLEQRLHVALDSSSGTYVDGVLFSTAGLRFATPGWQELGLWLEVDEAAMPGRSIRSGAGPLGGERRLAEWVPSNVQLPDVPPAVRGQLTRSGDTVCVRVILATPALFEGGALPGAGGPLLSSSGGVATRLVAAAVGRPQTVSGWDFAERRPKPTRRLAPAGSVYWLELRGPVEARAAWLDRVWGSNVSDAEQDRRDGYGLAFVGVE